MSRRILATSALACVIAILAGRAPLYGDEKAEEKKIASKKDVKEMMVKAHKGEKSPFTDLSKELMAETPDWNRVTADVKVLTETADVLSRYVEGYTYHYYGGPWRYIDSTKALDKATRDRDHKAATAAFTNLTKSCSACHHTYGNPR
jgi:cytochrome c556